MPAQASPRRSLPPPTRFPSRRPPAARGCAPAWRGARRARARGRAPLARPGESGQRRAVLRGRLREERYVSERPSGQEEEGRGRRGQRTECETRDAKDVLPVLYDVADGWEGGARQIHAELRVSQLGDEEDRETRRREERRAGGRTLAAAVEGLVARGKLVEEGGELARLLADCGKRGELALLVDEAQVGGRGSTRGGGGRVRVGEG